MPTMPLDLTKPDTKSWQALSPEEKKVQLYRNQKHALELFLERNAISQEQYDKSLRDLTIKMGMESLLDKGKEYA